MIDNLDVQYQRLIKFASLMCTIELRPPITKFEALMFTLRYKKCRPVSRAKLTRRRSPE